MPAEEQTQPEDGMVEPISISEMKLQISKSLHTAEIELAAALQDLAAVISSDEREALKVLQQIWESYREALSAYARAEFTDGSNAGLAAASAKLAETERRTTAILCELEARQDK